MGRDRRPKTRDLDKKPYAAGESGDDNNPDGMLRCGLIGMTTECPAETTGCPSC